MSCWWCVRRAFAKAYVGSFGLYPDSEVRNRELTLILMASSADPTVFKELLRGKKYLEKVTVPTSPLLFTRTIKSTILSQTLTGPDMANKIFTSIQQDSIAGD